MLAFERTLIGYSISYRIVSYRIVSLKCPFSLEIRAPWLLGPQTSSRSVHPFLQSSRSRPTDTKTILVETIRRDIYMQPTAIQSDSLVVAVGVCCVNGAPNNPSSWCRRQITLDAVRTYCRMVLVQAPILAIRLSAQQVISPVVGLYWKSIFRHHFPGLLTMGPNFIELKISVYLLLTNVCACQRLCYRKAAKHLIVELGSDTESQNFR